MKMLSKGWLLLAAIVVIAAAAAATGGLALAGSTDTPDSAKGLGPLTGLLPRDHLTVESALQVDLGKESVRLPLYKGNANGETVWYVLVDASDQGIAQRSGHQLRAQAREHRHRLPRLRPDRDAGFAVAGAEQVRTGARQLQGCAGLQPDPDRRARADRLPAGEVPARRCRRSRVQPVHPDRGLADGIQRPDRRNRRWAVRRRPPHEHG